LLYPWKKEEKKGIGGFISYHLFMPTTKSLRHVLRSVAANRPTAPTKKTKIKDRKQNVKNQGKDVDP
jgi:hypothetical protein